uniref:Uncharacterized protein n=1 Tax=Siphoviridae sp. ctkyE7 TaxID=2827926 RepID=A0A8S5SS14_9CAUD|nr:MAG TPA: hypothetical protein [Siphoviridae sp. ctkyE7]DAJ78375.1 MAG TPA: hypothetical protein [Caudoviricetes sp.]
MNFTLTPPFFRKFNILNFICQAHKTFSCKKVYCTIQYVKERS